jgi:hypothetical protein
MTAHTRPEESPTPDPPGVTMALADVYRQVAVEPGDVPKGKPAS